MVVFTAIMVMFMYMSPMLRARVWKRVRTAMLCMMLFGVFDGSHELIGVAFSAAVLRMRM